MTVSESARAARDLSRHDDGGTGMAQLTGTRATAGTAEHEVARVRTVRPALALAAEVRASILLFAMVVLVVAGTPLVVALITGVGRL
jgi:hypothetical protein